MKPNIEYENENDTCFGDNKNKHNFGLVNGVNAFLRTYIPMIM